MVRAMTEEEQAILQRWQFTDGGRAELALHAMAMAASDLEKSACTHDGFTTIRKTRAELIKAREILDRLIESTSLFHAQAAE